MEALPDAMLNHFFHLREWGRDGPFRVELRALFRERPISSSPTLWEFELATYANDVLVGRKTAVDTQGNKAARMEAMMEELLRQSLLFGMFVAARQTQTLDDDFPEAHAPGSWLCPYRLGLKTTIEGELLPNAS